MKEMKMTMTMRKPQRTTMLDDLGNIYVTVGFVSDQRVIVVIESFIQSVKVELYYRQAVYSSCILES